MNNLVVTKQVVAQIEWNKEVALQEAKDIMAKYEGLEFTEEQLPEAKKELATLRKVSKEINSQALAIDKELTLPVKTFRNEVKEVKAIVDSGVAFIDEQVKSFENALKEERRLEILSLDEFEAISEFVTFDESWLLKKWNDKLLVELFTSVKNDLDSSINTISLLATTNGLDKEFYIDKLKVQSLEQVVERITEDMQNLKVEVKEEAPTIIVDTNEKVVEVTRTLKGTVTELKELKRYAESIGVEWTK